ncbi:MAG: carboxypeptidase-like regulatory domain-containing protein [Chitinophagales bacterium]
MNIRRWTVPLPLAVAALLLAALPAFAAETWTIKGRVTYPDGRPAVGVELKLVPWSPQGLDMGNIVYKIPNYDWHLTTTDANGYYVMNNVIDYPENTAHRYTVWVTEKIKTYHGTVNFPLRRESFTPTVDVHLEEAAWVTVKLKDRAGKPFNGTRAVFIQTGTNLSDPSTGYTKVSELTFVNGEAGVRIAIRDKNAPLGRIAILDFPSRTAAHQAMQARALKISDTSLDGLKLMSHDARGKGLDRQFPLPPVSETTVEFTL